MNDLVMVQFEEQCVEMEESLASNPYNPALWYNYLDAQVEFYMERLTQKLPAKEMRQVKKDTEKLFKRALKLLPGSYKLWMKMLDVLKFNVKHLSLASREWDKVNARYDQALGYLNKMPRVWLDFVEFLMVQKKVTKVRRVFDAALQSLPLSQHSRVWDKYIEFAISPNVPPETGMKVLRRYLLFAPTKAETLVDYLIVHKQYNEACVELAKIVDNPDFDSQQGKSKRDLYIDLCEIATRHADQVAKAAVIDVDSLIRGGLAKFKDDSGRLWCALANYHTRLGAFERTRGIYEEALGEVRNVKDFSVIFDAYAQFEEATLSARLSSSKDEAELDLRLARLDRLMEQRPLMLNSVCLKQTPHDVGVWLERVALMGDDLAGAIQVFVLATQTIKASLATNGSAMQVWKAFALFYETHQDYASADHIFATAMSSKTTLRNTKNLVELICSRLEFKIRREEYESALEVCRAAVEVQGREADAAHRGLHFSNKLWSFLADLVENLEGVEETTKTYEQMVALKIATPQTILRYATMLQENKYFEASFAVYERGLELFGWPYRRELWIAYLRVFTMRFGDSKIERARDLFEQAVNSAPAMFCEALYLMYASYEEKCGLGRRAMKVYERACASVEAEAKFAMYLVYISRCEATYGATKAREVYQKAIESVIDEHVPEMCLRFADLETKLGEMDRARAIIRYGSQVCDEKTAAGAAFWTAWDEFEMEYGNEDNYREMLRVKRTIALKFSPIHSGAGYGLEEHKQAEEEEPEVKKVKVSEPEDQGETAAVVDEAEIDLDDDESEEEEETEKPPSAGLGALARLKAKGLAN